MTTYSAQQKPSLVSAIAAMTMVSGIVNIFWGLIASMTALVTLVGVVPPLHRPAVHSGRVRDDLCGQSLGNLPQAVRPATTLAAFEIASILAGNAFSMIVGILALVFYNDLMVKAWFAEINGAQPLAALLHHTARTRGVSRSARRNACEAPCRGRSRRAARGREIPPIPRRPRKVA